MWRHFSRRALIGGRTATQKLLLPYDVQVMYHEAVTLPCQSIESASHLLLFSRDSHVYPHLRPFSSNRAENYEDPPFERPNSEGNEIEGAFNFSKMNPDTESEFGDEDSIFYDATEGLEEIRGFSNMESFDSSGALDENLESAPIEDEKLEEGKRNDSEVFENLLSVLQSSWTVRGSLESKLEDLDLILDDEAVLKVLETPFIPGENLISFFKWNLKKPEFKLTAPVLYRLVCAICTESRRMEVYALWDLVKEVGDKEKGVVSTESLNKLIEELSRLGKAKAAFEVFCKFEEFDCHLNADTYCLTINALCKRSFHKWVNSVCESMLQSDKLPDVDRVGKIISSLCRGGMLKDAHLVYVYAKDKNIYPPQSSVDFLIRSLSRIERTVKGGDKVINKELDKETVCLALDMLAVYSAEHRKYAIKPFSSVIKKLCWIEDVDRAKKLLLDMIDSGPSPGNEVFNWVINGLKKTGDMKEALNMMKLMEGRGLKPDVYTYSVLMSGYASGGEMEEACKIFEEAKRNHSKLTPVTFHILIRGFCNLEQFDKAVSLLGEMKLHGVYPNHDEYNKLIKSLCLKALDWETAEKLQEDMKENGLTLNGRTIALIRAIKELKEGECTEISCPAQFTFK